MWAMPLPLPILLALTTDPTPVERGIAPAIGITAFSAGVALGLRAGQQQRRATSTWPMPLVRPARDRRGHPRRAAVAVAGVERDGAAPQARQHPEQRDLRRHVRVVARIADRRGRGRSPRRPAHHAGRRAAGRRAGDDRRRAQPGREAGGVGRQRPDVTPPSTAWSRPAMTRTTSPSIRAARA